MKAYVLEEVNKLQYKEVPVPECKSGWAIVKVKAAGICSSDISRIFTKGTYHFPTIPGHEFSGIVSQVKDKKDSSWIGKHVGIFPLIPCKNCLQCKEKHYEMCSSYDYIGSRRDGAFAEYVAVPIWNLIEIPNSITFTQAAMLEPLAVGLHACKIADINLNSKVAIVGTGMIGISAAQWAKSMGTKNVCVIGRNENKRNLVKKNQIYYINQTIEEVKDDYNVVIEAVGDPNSIDIAINCTMPGGTLVLMGNPSSNITLTQNTYWRILRKQLKLHGTWNSSYQGTLPSDWTKAVNALSNNIIHVENLITHCFSQENLMQGLTLMKEHKNTYCKVMTIWNK